MEILLSPEQVGDAEALGEETFEQWKRAPGRYRNTPNSHRKGKLGELAVELWLQGADRLLDSPFRELDREREADVLAVGPLRLEVKTWTAAFWPRDGRCVTPGQMRPMRARADAVVWCSVQEDDGGVRVTVHGWSTLDDIAATALRETGPGYRKIVNHQVEESELRPLEELLESGTAPQG